MQPYSDPSLSPLELADRCPPALLYVTKVAAYGSPHDYAMKTLFLLFLFLATRAIGQLPMVEAVAYSRAITPGIPTGNTDAPLANNPFPVKYFIYIIVKQ